MEKGCSSSICCLGRINEVVIRMRRKKKLLIATILIILFILFGRVFLILWESVFVDIVPYKKTEFEDYNEFYQQSIRNFFPSELPVSATNIEYYYYSGMLDKIYALSFSTDDVGLEYMKEIYWSHYDILIESDTIVYVFDKQLTYDFVNVEKIQFLEELLEGDLEQYEILAYEKGCNEHSDVKSCVLYNDETNKFVISFYHDQLFMEKE